MCESQEMQKSFCKRHTKDYFAFLELQDHDQKFLLTFSIQC